MQTNTSGPIVLTGGDLGAIMAQIFGAVGFADEGKEEAMASPVEEVADSQVSLDEADVTALRDTSLFLRALADDLEAGALDRIIESVPENLLLKVEDLVDAVSEYRTSGFESDKGEECDCCAGCDEPDQAAGETYMMPIPGVGVVSINILRR